MALEIRRYRSTSLPHRLAETAVLTAVVVTAGLVADSTRAADRRDGLGKTEKFSILVDKVLAVPSGYVISEKHITEIAEAGFNVVSPRRGFDDPQRVRREAGWAQKHGMFFVSWMRGTHGAKQGPRMLWEDGSEQVLCSPNSDELWDWMTERILANARISRDVPALIGTFLDFENYRDNRPKGIGADLYGLSYDDKILGQFSRARGISLPKLDPDNRKDWLVQQKLHDDFSRFQFAQWRLRCRKLRVAVDAINPKFQFFICPGLKNPFMRMAAFPEWSTSQAPVVICLESTYGRRTNLTPQKQALATNRKSITDFTKFMRTQRVPFMILGGIDPVVKGADPEFSARNALAIAQEADGYWVFYEGPTYGKPDHAAYMEWFAKANKVLLERDYAFQHAERETAHPLAGKHLEMKLQPYSSEPMPPEAANYAFRVRFGQTCLVLLEAGEQLRGRVECRKVRKDRPATEFLIVDPDGKELYSSKIEAGGGAPIRVKAKKTGLHCIAVAAEKNTAQVFLENQYVCVLVPDTYLGLMHDNPRAYFMVEAWAAQMQIKVYSASSETGGETVRIVLRDPDGKVLVQDETVGKRTIVVKTQVHPKHAGRPWSIEFSEASKGVLDDIYFTLGEGCGRLVATHPSRLLIPK